MIGFRFRSISDPYLKAKPSRCGRAAEPTVTWCSDTWKIIIIITARVYLEINYTCIIKTEGTSCMVTPSTVQSVFNLTAKSYEEKRYGDMVNSGILHLEK